MTLSENIKEVLFAIYSFKGYPDQCEKDLLQAFEPLNFITSLFFIIIAFLLYREMKKHKIKKTSYYLSLIFVLSFALGSLLWHSMKNPYSHFIDTISISLTLIALVYILLMKIFSNKTQITILLGVLIIIQGILWSNFSFYRTFPYLLLIGFVIYLIGHIKIKLGSETAIKMITAAWVGGVGLIFKEADFVLCSMFPIGTHFIWHTLIGISLYLFMKELILMNKK